MASLSSITTAEQLLQSPDLGPCELVRGDLIMMSPAGSAHGGIIGTITILLGNFVKTHGLGRIMGAETGFLLAKNPDTVRAPDVAFVGSSRLPPKLPRGYFPGPPDLAVEVLSPHDRSADVAEKIRDWIESGCCEVWVVDPDKETVDVYSRDGIKKSFSRTDTISGCDLFPGLVLSVAEIIA